MADFQLALAATLANEAGLQAIAADRGNQQPDGSTSHTNRGVTLGTLKAWRSSQKRPVPTDADVISLTLAETAQIYRWLAWAPINGDAMASQALATVVFDAAVLCGTATSAKMLQQVIAGCGQAILADGNIGPKSLTALSALSPGRVLHMLIDRHSDRFADIALADASQAVFLPVWRRRRSGWTQLALA